MEENVNEDTLSCGRNRWKEPRAETYRGREGNKEGRKVHEAIKTKIEKDRKDKKDKRKEKGRKKMEKERKE